MAKRFESLMRAGHAPEWMMCGVTTLCHKNGPTTVAKNYRPIKYLTTCWKTLTLLLTDRIYEFLTAHRLMPIEQKGAMRKSHGCKDHLLIDKILTQRACACKNTISMGWIDYKKHMIRCLIVESSGSYNCIESPPSLSPSFKIPWPIGAR